MPAFETALQNIVEILQPNRGSMRLPRVQAIASEIQYSLKAKIDPIAIEIKSFDDKAPTYQRSWVSLDFILISFLAAKLRSKYRIRKLLGNIYATAIFEEWVFGVNLECDRFSRWVNHRLY